MAPERRLSASPGLLSAVSGYSPGRANPASMGHQHPQLTAVDGETRARTSLSGQSLTWSILSVAVNE